jgi:NitT/TauT family transport system substrate-binding protein
MKGIGRRTFLRGGLATVGAAAAWPTIKALAAPAAEKLRLCMDWLPQAQFAGYILARELGYFRDRGLDVEIHPGGPDHPALGAVATGAADVGIGPMSLAIIARAKAVPVKIIAQPLRDSLFRFVLKNENRIVSLRQLVGKPIGLWLGGDEDEFVAIIMKQGLTLDDFKVIRQDSQIAGFIQDKYVLSQVSVINEMIMLRKAGYPERELQILSPSDYGVAMPSDCLFTTDDVLAKRRPALVKFLDGARQGWRTAFADKAAAVKLLVGRYPALDPDHQMAQLKAMEPLVSGPDGDVPFGHMDPVAIERVQQEMVTAKLLPGPLFLPDVMDVSLLRDLPPG